MLKEPSKLEPGEEQWEVRLETILRQHRARGKGRPRLMVEYIYKSPDGTIWATHAWTLTECRRRRDAWLRSQKEQRAKMEVDMEEVIADGTESEDGSVGGDFDR